MSKSSVLEKLRKPPIAEVVCGIYFDEITELDPVAVGAYWGHRRDEFPKRQLHPAVFAPAVPQQVSIGTGLPRLRTWLISRDDSYVIQIQHDRFYLNWRLRSEIYPRFSAQGGLQERVIAEYTEFSQFCEREFQTAPTPAAIELGKIDHFVEGRDWIDKRDMTEMFPGLNAILQVAKTESPNVLMHFKESREGHPLQVSLTTATTGEGTEKKRILRLETTVIRHCGPSLIDARDSFAKANLDANEVFAALIPKDQRAMRFQSKES
ncbi:MAG TPA: TIGR04255 family protein [Vicinamibacteria bacterium]|nr:TIGR04255 family protein [Vicinamibacteria bacterium]